MKMPVKTIVNAVGRSVPVEVNGKVVIPYKGVGQHRPEGKKYGPPITTCIDFPADGNKRVSTLKEALIKAGLKNGMTISTHHHFRNGDLIAQQIFDIAAALGVKDLVWFPSASFDCHASLIKYLEDGTLHRIEGSMNGQLGRFTSEGRMRGVGVLRSHGGRYQAVQD
nr:citrate lyase subunit alpha [Bacteroidota bacterium]